ARRRASPLSVPRREWQSAEDVISRSSSIGTTTTTVERENASAFFPDLLVATQDGPVTASPAGAIAGVIARTDRSRGLWKAPAGLEAAIAGTVGVARAINTAGASTLSHVGV